MRRLFILAFLVCLAGQAFGQATPTPTNRALQLAHRVTCTSPPCTFATVDLGNPGPRSPGNGGGVKTCAVELEAGTATIQCWCSVIDGEVTAQIGTDLNATGARSTELWCDGMFLKITACSGCTVSGWARQDRRYR